jgi:hypothetical protein
VVIGAKGGEIVKLLFTKIELKGGEAQRGRKILFKGEKTQRGELIKEGDQLKF